MWFKVFYISGLYYLFSVYLYKLNNSNKKKISLKISLSLAETPMIIITESL